MIEQAVTLQNKRGLHARASAKLLETVHPFKSTVTVEYGGQKANAGNLIELLMLGAGVGSKLNLKAEGPDETEALQAALNIIQARFGEAD